MKVKNPGPEDQAFDVGVNCREDFSCKKLHRFYGLMTGPKRLRIFMSLKMKKIDIETLKQAYSEQ